MLGIFIILHLIYLSPFIFLSFFFVILFSFYIFLEKYYILFFTLWIFITLYLTYLYNCFLFLSLFFCNLFLFFFFMCFFFKNIFVWDCGPNRGLSKFNFFWLKINFFIFSYHFDMLMSEINFIKKNIILMHFRAKNTLKSNCYHTLKHRLRKMMFHYINCNIVLFFCYIRN